MQALSGAAIGSTSAKSEDTIAIGNYGGISDTLSENSITIGYRGTLANSTEAVLLGARSELGSSKYGILLGTKSSLLNSAGVRYEQNADGTTNYNNVTMGNGQAPNGTRISNVAPGIAGTDAVNMNQLNATNNRIEDVARNAYAGVAAAMATQMPGTYVPGKTVMRVGSAVFKGEPAVGVSFRRTSENNGWSVTGGVGMSRAGVAATVGAEWVFN